jgi:hypothetical protein
MPESKVRKLFYINMCVQPWFKLQMFLIAQGLYVVLFFKNIEISSNWFKKKKLKRIFQ